jgi:hypothetical protein
MFCLSVDSDSAQVGDYRQQLFIRELLQVHYDQASVLGVYNDTPVQTGIFYNA